MEKFQEQREKARKTIQLADHMLTMTYPMLKDPKILLSVLDNINNSIDLIISSILELERTFKRVPGYQDNFDSKLRVFREKVMPKYKISQEHLKLILKVRELMLAHKESPVEFTRKNNLVMATDNYEIRTLNDKSLKEIIFKAKVFINEVAKVTEQNDGLFR